MSRCEGLRAHIERPSPLGSPDRSSVLGNRENCAAPYSLGPIRREAASTRREEAGRSVVLGGSALSSHESTTGLQSGRSHRNAPRGHDALLRRAVAPVRNGNLPLLTDHAGNVRCPVLDGAEHSWPSPNTSRTLPRRISETHPLDRLEPMRLRPGRPRRGPAVSTSRTAAQAARPQQKFRHLFDR